VQLLNTQSIEAQEQAVATIGNVAGESATCRDFILEHGFLKPLLK
jgi:importin subunit alpha-1